jgi:predicted CXXCH cytochrome family protein
MSVPMRESHRWLHVDRWVVLLCVLGVVAMYASVRSEARTPDEGQSDPRVYVGSETCIACHEEAYDQLSNTLHGRLLTARERDGNGYLCEGCHGPGSAHTDDPIAEEPIAVLRQALVDGTSCLDCHDGRVSRVKWQSSKHRRGEVTCLTCHSEVGQSHAEMDRKPATSKCLSCHREQSALLRLPSHHPVATATITATKQTQATRPKNQQDANYQQRINCSDCHDSHARMGREMKREVCVQCHKEQRGPYTFEHGAISGRLTDGCLDCHRSHGSPNRELLKLNNRGLCLQCHGDKVLHFVGPRCWTCHKGMHGSNTSPFLFTE